MNLFKSAISEPVTILVLKFLRFAVDMLIAVASFYSSYVIISTAREINWVPGIEDKTAGFAAICAVVFVYMQVGRGSWRHVSLPDVLLLCKATALSIAAYMLAAFLVSRGQNVPRTLPFLTFVFMTMGLVGVRVIYRIAVEGSWLDAFGIRADAGKTKVLLFGFNNDAETYIRTLRRQPNSDRAVVGLIDDDLINRTRSIHGVPVLGTLEELEKILAKQRRNHAPVSEMILTERSPSQKRLSEIVEKGAANGLRITRLLDPTDSLLLDESSLAEPKAIELGDLLGRPEVKADMNGVARLVRNRVVLVTGAGGSIGSELCRQIALVNPKRLIITDSSEFHLYLLDSELRDNFPKLNIVTRILNVRESARARALFAEFAPEVVFHAAALKHVPMVEDNPIEGVKTNVLGTRNIANAAIEAGTSTFVVISTDKAVNPTNIMGATKRAAEAYCQALDISSDTTRFTTVRFGNVLGSNGSVVPLFEKQIAAGGPVTVTHPHIVRYFMTIPEAVRLVLHASAHRQVSEADRGKITVLDMGKPVRILDLAERMIQLAGFKPHEDIQITFTGLRPGEKLYEELFDPSELQDGKTDDGYFIASPRVMDVMLLQRTFDGLETAVRSEDATRTINLLRHIVPEYSPGQAPDRTVAEAFDADAQKRDALAVEQDWR